MEKPDETLTIVAEEASPAVPNDASNLHLYQAEPGKIPLPANVRFLAGFEGHIAFFKSDGEEILRVEKSGDVFVKGRKVDTDLEVYNGLRDWLYLAEKENPDGSGTPLMPR